MQGGLCEKYIENLATYISRSRYIDIISGDVQLDAKAIHVASVDDDSLTTVLKKLSIDQRAQLSALREALAIVDSRANQYDGTLAERLAQLRAGS